MIDDLTAGPAHDEDPSFYTDWGDPREYTIGDMGVGECAGEVVSPIEFALTACEREAFEAQLHLEERRVREGRADGVRIDAARRGGAAEAGSSLPVLNDSRAHRGASSESSFTTRSYSSIRSPAASSRSISSRPTSNAAGRYNAESAHHLIEEAQLFIEARP